MAATAERYARQRLIPSWDQERIAAATAVIAGVGALGNEVAKNLALLGIGHLVLCDPDTVAESNLSRTTLFEPADVGRAKVDAAAAALGRLVPDLRVTARPTGLVRGVGLGELADAAVVMGCLDSRHARLQLLGRSALVGARLVDGGTHPWGGEVRVRLDPAQACYGCTLTAAQRAEQDTPAGCQPDSAAAAAPQPAAIVSTSLVAAWMTTAAVRLVLGAPLPWRLLTVDGPAGTSQPFNADRKPDCPYHRPFDAVTLSNVHHGQSAEQLLSLLPAGAEPLTWTPFPVSGICRHCTGRYPVDHEFTGGTIECPQCGSRIRPRFSQHIRDARPDTPLCDLGVAPEEVLAIRLPEGAYHCLRLSPANPSATSVGRDALPPTSR